MKTWLKNFTRTIPTVVCLIILLSFSACALKTPSAKITDAEIYDLTTKKVKLRFKIRIDNPNPVAITVNKLEYTLKAFEKKVVSDSVDKSIRIPESGKAEFKLPVTVTYSKLLSAGLTTFTKGKLEYTLILKITLDTPAGNMTLPITKSGTIKSKDFGKLFGKLDKDNPDEKPGMDINVEKIDLDLVTIAIAYFLDQH